MKTVEVVLHDATRLQSHLLGCRHFGTKDVGEGIEFQMGMGPQWPFLP